MSIYIGNLSYEVTEADLNVVFSDYGSVKRVHVPTDRDTGRPKGFAFVELSTSDEESKAIETLNGAEWMGRTMKVDEARERRKN
ncbi:RNA recognition motif domain-containing protein [Crocosphaera sp. Alani8]|uniref:RNA recognition motif domain-containing protein n=1 Tax=Crocosphaera sp. Alani8 TaxID=3038952 RepID=UPI00313CB11F